MKQVFLTQQHAPRLLVFFAGWGADTTPFRKYHPAACDYLLCYDYRTLDFDATAFASYGEIHVVGWSMGVWAASQALSDKPWPVKSSIAINGTPYPIDEQRGIPPEIYQGTLKGLTGASLHKFLRRMCADAAAFRSFLELTPRRPLDELREELVCIERLYSSLPSASFRWTQAVTGENDRIIPPDNQLRAWQEQQTPVRLTKDAHYQESTFQHYLQDRWTRL